MKKFAFLLLTLFTFSFLSSAPIVDRNLDKAALNELTTSLGIPENSDLIDETQKRWLRGNRERWELPELSSKERELVLAWAEKQDLFEPWTPYHNYYDKACILGATTPRMKARLDYLKKLWEEGIRFNEVVWLVGERPLDARVDGLMDLTKTKTEVEAAKILWEETDLPDSMRHLSVVFASAPMKNIKGVLKRPTTGDTLTTWLNTNPGACTALFVSDQPYCGYQFEVVKTHLPDSIFFDVVGEGVNFNQSPSAAKTLDTLARWLYQENIYLKKQREGN